MDCLRKHPCRRFDTTCMYDGKCIDYGQTGHYKKTRVDQFDYPTAPKENGVVSSERCAWPK